MATIIWARLLKSFLHIFYECALWKTTYLDSCYDGSKDFSKEIADLNFNQEHSQNHLYELHQTSRLYFSFKQAFYLKVADLVLEMLYTFCEEEFLDQW